MSSRVMAGDRPRVTIVTNGNVFSNLALSRLFDDTRSRVDYQVIVTTGLRRSRGNRGAEAWKLCRRWGWRYTAYKIATYVVPAMRQAFSRRPLFVRPTCRRLGIPVTVLRSVNTPSSGAIISGFSPDLLLSFSCPYRISPDVLALPRIGCLNVHSSLLPAFAGVGTYVHVLAEGEKVTGVTVHEMVEEFDAGRIVAQREIGIEEGHSVCALFAEQCRVAGEMLPETIQNILARSEIGGREQDVAERSYRGEPGARDIARLRERGHRLMRWGDFRLFSVDIPS